MSRAIDESRAHYCVVLLTGLGDVVHGLPLVNAIRDAYPHAAITWVVEPMPSAILEGQSSIDNVVVYRRAEGLGGISRLRRDLRSLAPVDITLNLNVYIKSVWPTFLSGARRRIGFDKNRSHEGVWLASNERLEAAPRAHTADMFLEFAKHLRIPVPHPEWRLSFTPGEIASQAGFFRKFDGTPVATIVPASASIKKDWIAERWAAVAEQLVRQHGFRVVLAGGPGNREQQIAREIVARAGVPIEWGMGDSVRQLAWILAGSSLVLAPDTGPVHIARAFDVPVVGIYGHTNPWRVGPWRAFADLWVDRYTEPGEVGDPSNRTPKWERMPTITVDDVMEKVAVAVTKYGVLERAAGRNTVFPVGTEE